MPTAACRSRRPAPATRGCRARCRLALVQLILGGALLLSAPFVVSAAAESLGRLAGCWEQTSHAPLVQPSSGEEWGARSWCFARTGKLISRTLACGASGCDGWDNERRYRWRPPYLSLSDIETAPDGKAQTRVWRRCRVQFLTLDWMQLLDCNQSTDPWVREMPTRR